MNTLSIFSDIQSSFCNNFEYENGGEIPRRSVDHGLSTSPIIFYIVPVFFFLVKYPPAVYIELSNSP